MARLPPPYVSLEELRKCLDMAGGLGADTLHRALVELVHIRTACARDEKGAYPDTLLHSGLVPQVARDRDGHHWFLIQGAAVGPNTAFAYASAILEAHRALEIKECGQYRPRSADSRRNWADTLCTVCHRSKTEHV